MKQKNSVLQNKSVPAFVPYGARQLTPGENSRILLAHHTIYVSMSLAENHIAYHFFFTNQTDQPRMDPTIHEAFSTREQTCK
jgi:hypothetical protein